MQPFSYFPQYGEYNSMIPGIPSVPQPKIRQVVMVDNEAQAQNFGVDPGNSVTFFHASEPICYVKTAGKSPFEASSFKRYRLVEDTEPSQPDRKGTVSQDIDLSGYALKSDLTTGYDSLKSEIASLKAQISELRMAKSDIKPNLNLEYDGVD